MTSDSVPPLFVTGSPGVIPCQINQFFAKFVRPPPISMKFSTLEDNA